MTIDTKRLRELLSLASPSEWAIDESVNDPNIAAISFPNGYIEFGGSRFGREARAALVAEAINALPALLDLAERYESAPEGEPTHWRPLPAPPAIANERGE